MVVVVGFGVVEADWGELEDGGQVKRVTCVLGTGVERGINKIGPEQNASQERQCRRFRAD